MKKLLIVTAALILGLAQAQAQSTTTTTTDGAQTVQENDTMTTTSTTTTDEGLSKGGLFLEPMVFASQEDMIIESSQISSFLNDTSGTSKGYGAGLRFGGHVSEIFMLGVDGRYSKNRIEDSAYGAADADVYNIAPMVGLQTPIAGIRLTGSYVLAGENNPEEGTQGFDVKFKEATGWRVGAGVHVLAVAINLEYQNLTYNTTEVESLGPIASNTNFDVDTQTEGYTLSVSFPVEL